MMDFGFASFLDKFEDKFGKFLTGMMLLIIALAIFAFCGNIIVTVILLPAINIIKHIISILF